MPTTGSRSFVWTDLDQRIFAPEQDKFVDEERKKIADFQKSAHLAGYLSRLLDFQEGLIKERADWFYTACCETWKEQGQSISQQFLRVISYKITQLIRARRSAVETEIRARGKRINEPPHPFVLQGWKLRMDRLADRWKRKLEGEAAKLEYRQVQREQESGGFIDPKKPEELPGEIAPAQTAASQTEPLSRNHDGGFEAHQHAATAPADDHQLGKKPAAPTSKPNTIPKLRSDLKRVLVGYLDEHPYASNKDLEEFARHYHPNKVPAAWDSNPEAPGKYFPKVRKAWRLRNTATK